MINKIRLVVTDIDGVLTDGKVMISSSGNSICKVINFKDLDAVGMLKELGIELCIITGEDDEFVNIIEKEFNPVLCVRKCKDKCRALQQISTELNIPVSEMIYIGDGKYDIDAIKMAGVGMCPANAIFEVKHTADYVLEICGGEGCLAAIYTFCRIQRSLNE